MKLIDELWKVIEPIYHRGTGGYNKWAHGRRDKNTTYSYPEAMEQLKKLFRQKQSEVTPKWDKSYWYKESPVWNHLFTKVTYNTGDVVWISKQTGRAYCGRTHDGWFWQSPSGPLHNVRGYPIVSLKGSKVPRR